MKALTINNHRILFGALVITLGLSKSWFYNTERNITGSRDLAQVVETAPTAGARTASPTITHTFNVQIDGESKTVHARLTNVDLPGTNSFTTGPDGITLIPVSGQTQKSIQATFTYANGCSTCSEIDPLTITAVQGAQEILSTLQNHLSTQIREKAERERQEEQLQADLDNCRKMRDGDEIIDLTDRDNRDRRMECRINNLDIADDDRDAARKIQRELGRDLMRMAESEDPEDREEAIRILDDLESDFSSNRSAERYLRRLKDGAIAFHQITAYARESVMNPDASLNNNLYIDHILGTWDRLKFNAQNGTEATRLATDSWYNPIATLARQSIRDADVVARSYFDLGIVDDMNRIDPNSFAGDRMTRTSIGLSSIPMYRGSSGRIPYEQYPTNSNPNFDQQRSRYDRGNVQRGGNRVIGQQPATGHCTDRYCVN